MTLRRVAISISDIETVVEAREIESPFVRYKLEPIGAAGELCTPIQSLRLRN
jgi:hypothetical protein